jgi:hypothetical protein
MVFIKKSLTEMLEEIEFRGLGSFDYIVPNENKQINPGNGLIITEEYYHQLQEDLKNYVSVKRLPMSLVFAIENAYMRGNNCSDNLRKINNGHLPIGIKSFYGKEGMVIRIRDSGKGFNFVNEIEKCNFRGEIHGMAMMDACLSEVSYEGNGSVVNIMIKN